MPQTSTRNVLRSGTEDLHDLLDRQVGRIDTGAAYVRYLRGSHAFRAAIEPALHVATEGKDWQPVALAATLKRDLADLGIQPLAALETPQLTDLSATAGALYVVEGSALGAALIARRAAAIGFVAGSGATHLAQQTGEPGRWRAFLRWLDTSGCDVIKGTAAARAVFDLALVSFGVTEGCRSTPSAGSTVR